MTINSFSLSDNIFNEVRVHENRTLRFLHLPGVLTHAGFPLQLQGENLPRKLKGVI